MRTRITRIFFNVSLPVSLSLLMMLASCGGDDPKPSARDKIKEKLVGATWNMESVTVDGVDRTDVYEGLTITFGEGIYTTTQGGPVWPASDTWTFASDDATAVTRGDGIRVDVEATEGILQLSLTWTKTTYGQGRVASMQGQHVFTFAK
jgi:hypothetical protein